MRQAIKKELLEGSRAYKFLIIFAVFVFFALMDPILNKMVLPEVLKSQFNNIGNDMLNQMLVTSQRDCVRGYLTDAFQIATLVVVLSLSSLVAGEIKNKTFIFPICSKNDFATLIISKMVVYGTYLILVATTCTLIDYAYAGALFGWDLPSVLPVLRSGLLQGIYYVYVLTLIMLAGSFISKPITAGLVALIPAYGTHIISQLFNVSGFTPSGLIEESELIAYNISTNIAMPIIVTIVLSVMFIILTVIRLEKLELSRR